MQKEEKTLKVATVIYLIKDGKILLPKKARKIGAGRRNGYGGGVEEGETIEESALREVEEEAGVKGDPESLKKIAELQFKNTKTDGSTWDIVVHMFSLSDWTGEPHETIDAAMTDLKWFPLDQIPFEEMMDADSAWLPNALAGKKLIVKTHYGPFQKELLEPVEITEVSSF